MTTVILKCFWFNFATLEHFYFNTINNTNNTNKTENTYKWETFAAFRNKKIVVERYSMQISDFLEKASKVNGIYKWNTILHQC